MALPVRHTPAPTVTNTLCDSMILAPPSPSLHPQNTLHYPNTCPPLPIRIFPHPSRMYHFVHPRPDPFEPGPNQYIRPDLDRLRVLHRVPKRHARHTKNTGFLLDTARIRQDEAGIGFKLQEF